jgi:hypothetical protein
MGEVKFGPGPTNDETERERVERLFAECQGPQISDTFLY